MLRAYIVVLPLFLAGYAHSISVAEDSLRGKFTFNWAYDPAKQKCVHIGDKLMSLFRSSQFKCDPQQNTASGSVATVCTKVDGSSSYMIFDTFASCENERTTQAANE